MELHPYESRAVNDPPGSPSLHRWHPLQEPGGLHAPALAPPREGGRVRALDRWLVRSLLRATGHPSCGVVLWNGEELGTAAGESAARLRLHDRRVLLRMLVNPHLAFGDAYSEGRIDVQGDLVRFLEAAYRVSARSLPGGLLPGQ